MSKKYRIIFWGSPEFAADILERLIKKKFDILAVVTQSDKKIGRKREIVESAVKKIALKNKLKVFQPESLKNEEFIAQIKNLKPDLAVVAAYGKILPQSILDIPRRGSINVHASLLPKYRGASPIQSALIAGDEKTGITLMRMDAGLDTGNIIAQSELIIRKDETAEALTERLAALGGKLLLETIEPWIEGKIEAVPQDNGLASYSKIIRRQDGEIDWTESAENIYRKYKAYYPWPGLYTSLKINGELRRVKLTEIYPLEAVGPAGRRGEVLRVGEGIAVKTDAGLLTVKRAQIEGKKSMAIEEIIKGFPNFVGSVFQKNTKK